MKPLLRQADGTAKRAADGIAENACNSVCCDTCCASDCIIASFTDWPAFRYGALPTVINPFSYLTGPWILQRVAGCHFIYDCAIDETIDGVHYDRFIMDAYVAQHLDGTMFIQSFVGYLVPDTGDIEDVIYIIPPDPTDAPAPGCDQTINAGLVDYPDAVLTIAYNSGADCTDPDCPTPDSCTLCCPTITCAHIIVHYMVTWSAGAGGGTTTYTRDFPMDRGTPSDCWYDGSCFDPVTGNRLYEATAHVVCDGDGIPQLLHLGMNDFESGVSFLVNTPQAMSCGGTATPSPDFTYFNPTNIDSVSSVAISFELKDFCDQVENCTSTPLPTECPDPCIICNETCGTRCWTGATITPHYNLQSGECGICSSTETGDGCGKCCNCDPTCNCPCPVTSGRVPNCPCVSAVDAAACAAYALTHPGYAWCCDEQCIADGNGFPGDGASTCSRLDYEGDIELTFTASVGDEIHFGGTLDFGGGETIVFDVWFDCTDEIWFGTVTISGHCVFSGQLGGNCQFFPGLPHLAGVDSDLPDSACTLEGTLGASDVEFLDYVCPD